MTGSKSQNQQILEYLLEGKSITPIEALNKFGCFRLSARIADLRAEGYPIHTELVNEKDNGVNKRYARYMLVQM